MKIHLISLGCDKNLTDSEKMLALSCERGYEFTDDPSVADVILVNTCAFILDAEQESVNTILEMAEVKKKDARLVVTGCLAERFKDDIKKEIPEVTDIIGNSEVENYLFENNVTKRVVTTGGHFAYLKIAEGCNKRCTYCIIPFLRGAYRSHPMEDLIEEAKSLAEGGVKELILVAQETTLYGIDIYKKKALPELLRRLSEIDGIEWIRIMYMYPEEITDELLETMKELPKVLHYFDIPIQHASDNILTAMGRRTRQSEIKERIEKIRSLLPDAVLRTTMIAGFPGETEEDFEELLRFIDETDFDRLGCFAYSKEKGTAAAKIKPQIPKRIKEKRRDAVMELQQQKAFEKASSRIGNVYRVIIEGRLPEEDVYVGRTYMDAPDVDGLVYFKAGKREYMTGDMVDVRVTAANGYDLEGEKI
ncbi:MAG: 30S ribosomal protein S12 methylthiotransferase RimO [Eubacteriales bacterium]|nr:30S ribosomal protein S12 methylthiotransferase RimO [Eubacteriales bacterium]